MIIKKLIIGRFGKLKDMNIDLKQGLNIIYGKNEAGKSTIQGFIKAMFYGMDSKKKKIRENDRKRFLPWSGENAFGEIYFEDKYKNTYIIQRTFGKKKKEDESVVLDVVTGKSSNNIDPNKPGLDFFGLGEDAFEKTIFVRQLMSRVAKDGEDEIIRRLSNLYDSGDEDVSYHKALEQLSNTKKDLTNVRKTGKIDKLKKDYTALQEQWGQMQKLQEENFCDQLLLNKTIDEKHILENKIKDLEKQKREGKELKIYKAYKKLMEYKGEIKELSKEKEESIKALCFNGHVIDQAFIDDIKEKHTIFIKQKNRYKEGENHKEFMQRKIEKKLKTFHKKLQTHSNTAMILGGITILVSAIFGLMKNSHLYGISIFGVFMCIYAFMQRKNITASIEDIKEEMEYISKDINSKKDELNNLETEIYEKIKPFYNGIMNIDKVGSWMSKYRGELNYKLLLERKISSLEDIYKALIQDQDIEKMKKIYESFIDKGINEGIDKGLDKGIDEEIIDDFIKEKQQRLITIEKEIKDIEHRIKTRFHERKPIVEIEEEIKRSNEKILYYEESIESLEIALGVLKSSFKEIQKNFGPRLNKTVGDILSSITENKYAQLKISEDYEVKIKEPIKNQIKEIEYFSNGTLDQIYFALRLGIIKLIFDKNFSVPFILDDAFVQYDEYRLDAVLKYLYEYAKKNQVILFTYQMREVERLKAFLDINIINL